MHGYPFQLPSECGPDHVEYVDAENRPLLVAPLGAAAALGLPFRVAGVALRDTKGRVLVRRNAFGRWDLSVTGIVRAGEAPEDAALREAAAALGLRGIRPVRVAERLPGGEARKRRLILFLAGPATPVTAPDGMFLDAVELDGLIACFPELIASDLQWAAPYVFSAAMTAAPCFPLPACQAG